MKKDRENKFGKKFIRLLIYFIILIFFIGLNFQDTYLFDGWQKLTFPINPDSAKIQDMTFVDSLIGYAVTKYMNPNIPAYILKTNNGGLNWVIQRKDINQFNGFTRVIFLNKDTGFVGGARGIERTTNGGMNWITLPIPSYRIPEDMYVFSIDTLWFVYSESGTGGIWRSIDGGYNWLEMSNGQYLRSTKIYFYNNYTGFVCKDVTVATNIYKTTNGGFNWVAIPVSKSFLQMKFVDSLRGFKVFDNLEKTTNGGLNWAVIDLPNIPGMFNTAKWIESLAIFSDTLYCFGSMVGYPNYKTTVLVYKSTNLGLNWGYQIIDSSFNISRCQWSSFINNQVGWCYNDWKYIIKTTNGGGTTILLDVNKNENKISKDFVLGQNYPNPFNQHTIINVQLPTSKHIRLDVYDIAGRLVTTVIDKKLSSGKHSIRFNAGNLSSWTYLYKLQSENNIDVKKMILIK